jgi:hypothetical protein
MKTDLTILQKLDLYQIIAYAKEGRTEQVIERAGRMLSEDESLVTMTPDEWRQLGEMSLHYILIAALEYKRRDESWEAIAS